MRNAIIILLMFMFFSISLAGIGYVFMINHKLENRIISLENKIKQKNQINLYQRSKLDKNLTLTVHPFLYQKDIQLSKYSQSITIFSGYCNISKSFFDLIEKELSKKNIVYKPKLKIDSFSGFSTLEFDQIQYTNLGQKINTQELKYQICDFINSKLDYNFINIDLVKYKYNNKEIESIQNSKLIGQYIINKYSKLPIISENNSVALLSGISDQIVNIEEQISVLENFYRDNGANLVKSNTLIDGQILQTEGGGACLGATILYRALLDAGLEIKQRKSHNIYYKNIYGVDKIGLDATIYFDEKYYIDLIFKNNNKSNLLFMLINNKESIGLQIYGQNDYEVNLNAIQTGDINNIVWNYEVKENEQVILKEKIISKYSEIDDF